MIGRPGFALIYALFMAAALSLIGLGLMATGTTEVRIAAATAHRFQARAAAEAAALDAVEAWSTKTYSGLPVGGTTELSQGAVAVAVVRLDSTSYLVRSRARHPPAATAAARGATARAGLLVRTLPAARLSHAFPAAISAERSIEVSGGAVHGDDTCGGPAPGAQAPAVAVAAGATVTGDPPVRVEAPPAPPAPDPFAPDLAAALATTRPMAASVSPRPLAEGGECLADGRNWGALDASHPCHDLLPFVHVTGSIRIPGGEGRGTLVVEGDARLSGQTRFQGTLVVRGHLVIEDGARVEGAIRAESVTIRNGEVRRHGCALRQALESPALDRAFRPPDRWWVPVF